MKDLILYNSLIKIILILIFIWLSYKILKFCVPKEHDLYKYKIKYFILNLITCISYIILFLILIFFVRTRFLDKDINLYLLFLEFKSLTSSLSYLNIISLGLVIVSLMFFFATLAKEIQKYFTNQIIKRYLYTFWGTFYGRVLCFNIQQISLAQLRTIIIQFIKEIAYYTNTKKYIENAGSQTYLQLFNICHFIVMKLPTILIYIYVLYELRYNNGILSSKFNSWLFIYLLYSIYKRITNYVIYCDNTINEMVFNMYYRDRSIKYVNMPEAWKNAVHKYVDNGLCWTSKEEAEKFDKTIGLINFFDGMFWRYTWISTDGYIYSNNNNEEFEEENNQSLDIVHYPFNPQDTTFNKNINNLSKQKNESLHNST